MINDRMFEIILYKIVRYFEVLKSLADCKRFILVADISRISLKNFK